MLQHLPALFVILVLATVVFTFASRPASHIIQHADFSRGRNLWLASTVTLFLSNSVWIYLIVVGVLLLFRTRESNPVALFFLLLFVAPTYQTPIPGMGLTNSLFEISHQRLLALVILFPAYLILINQKKTIKFGKTLPDKILAAYIILVAILDLREPSITNTLRQCLYLFTDIFLPYYVVSRYLKDMRGFREALLCFVIAVMILAILGIFEALRWWPLYDSIQSRYGLSIGYVTRAGFLRPHVSTSPIPLGYAITVAMGFFFYLQKRVESKFSRQSGLLLLISGLLASLSRGPWVGAVLLCLVFTATGKKPVKLLAGYCIGSLVALSLFAMFPVTKKFVDLLPFIGSSAEGAGTISFRERLMENSMIVIYRNPFFGSIDYLDTPEMKAIGESQGQNLIDIVNTYLQIALASGFIGLGLFIGIFLTILWGILRSFRRLSDKNSEEAILGRSLLATLAAILLIIFTVSKISIIPIVYWSVAGLGVAYVNMLNLFHKTQK